MDDCRGGGSLIQGSYGTRGNFELVTPSPTDEGFIHYNRDNDDPLLHWGGPCCYGTGPVTGVSLIQSNYGQFARNLFLATNEDGRLCFYYRSDATFRWEGPTLIATNIAGAPSIIQGTFGQRGNLELVVPLETEGLAHFYRDNDNPDRPWFGPEVFGDGHFGGAALIQSNFGIGHLEVVAERNGQLLHYWRDERTGRWHHPTIVAPEGIGGPPVLIQSTYGRVGNFEVVAPLARGGLVHYWRDNDDPAVPWRQSGTFGEGRLTHLGLVQSNFGTPGNLEVVARDGDRLVHFWRDLESLRWNSGRPVGIEHRRVIAECIYGWTQAYLQDWTHIVVRVHLEPEPGVSPTELDGLKERWRDGIRRAWNGQCGCRTARGTTRGLSFDVQWVSDEADERMPDDTHHRVRVRPGPVRSNLRAWGTNASGRVAAHEFGHMLGLVDEYEDILCPGRSPVGSGTLMDQVDGPVVERHVQALCQSLCTQAAVALDGDAGDPNGR